MDKYQKYELACKQFGSIQNPNPPMRIDWMAAVAWNILFERDIIDFEDTALVYLHVENRIGIADRYVKGYTPTPCVIGDGVNGQEAVDWFNQNILDLSSEESFRIVLSTF